MGGGHRRPWDGGGAPGSREKKAEEFSQGRRQPLQSPPARVKRTRSSQPRGGGARVTCVCVWGGGSRPNAVGRALSG